MAKSTKPWDAFDSVYISLSMTKELMETETQIMLFRLSEAIHYVVDRNPMAKRFKHGIQFYCVNDRNGMTEKYSSVFKYYERVTT